MLGGRYFFDDTFVIEASGNESRCIVISSYPGERAILDFRSTPYKTVGLKVVGDYLHISNFDACYAGSANISLQGSHNILDNLDVYGGVGGLGFSGESNLIVNVDSHDNFDYRKGGFTMADFGEDTDGISDKYPTGNPNVYRNCRLWNNSDDGVDFFYRNTPETLIPTVMEGCICYHNGPKEYDMRNHPRYEADKEWFDAIDNRIITTVKGEKVLVTLEHYPCFGNGNGFKLSGSRHHNVLLYNCLAVDNPRKGFDQNGDYGKMELYNCSAYLNGRNYGFGSGEAQLIIRNCVSFNFPGHRNDDFLMEDIVSDHNSWNTAGVTASESDFVDFDLSVLTAPRSADGSLPEGLFLHLRPNSSMIDAGVDLGYPYYGSAPDLGCYEYDGSYVYNPYSEVADNVKDDELGMKVYPNPFTDSFTVSCQGMKGEGLVAVYSSVGDEVCRCTFNEVSSDKMSFSVPEVPAGIYFVVLSTAEAHKVEKIVKY